MRSLTTLLFSQLVQILVVALKLKLVLNPEYLLDGAIRESLFEILFDCSPFWAILLKFDVFPESLTLLKVL